MFYPEGGGQAADTGTINGCNIYDVQKIGGVVTHKTDKINFREGDTVAGEINWAVREQHMKHHTAVHIINAAARRVLGNHVWQSGSAKSREKAHLDITHYESLGDEKTEEIERIANEIASERLRVNKKVMPRTEAESKYGMRIYQGGVVPEKNLRIIEISNDGTVDVEACGGTHCDFTSEVGRILVTSTERIQDGVVRINIVAGPRAGRYLAEKKALLEEIENILGAKGEKTIPAAQKLFEEWKKIRKEEQRHAEGRAEHLSSELEKKFVNNALVEKVEGDSRSLQVLSKKLSSDNRIVVLFGVNEKISVFVSAGRNTKANAGAIARNACEALGGKGGGSAELAQGFGTDREKLDTVMKQLRRDLNG